jgi:hypothetical protein
MPTALELTRAERKRYVEAIRRRPAPPELTPAERDFQWLSKSLQNK